jgi:hypothetical protein
MSKDNSSEDRNIHLPAMDVDDELQWGFLGFAFVVMVLVVVGIAETIYNLRRRKSTDQLLANVPYEGLLTTLELPLAFSS